MYSHIIAAVLAAAVAFSSAWWLQDNRYEAVIGKMETDASELEKQRALDLVTAISDSQKIERGRYEKLIQSERDAQLREEAWRRDAAAARRDADSLRDNLGALKAGLPGLTERAVRKYAATAGDLLGECAERYTSMGEKADGHANDVRKLMEAWPADD